MKHQLLELFKIFRGDIIGYGLYLRLHSLFAENERQLISMTKLSGETGLGRDRLRSALIRLEKYHLIELDFFPKLGIFIKVLSRKQPTLSRKQPISRKQRSRVPIAKNKTTNLPDLTKEKKHASSLIDVSGYQQAFQTSSDVLKFQTQVQVQLTTKPTKLKPKTKSKVRQLKFSVEDLELAREWLKFGISQMTWTKAPKSWTEENFANDLNKVRRITNAEVGALWELFRFIQKDDFWRDKVLAPSGLLKKSTRNDLRKIDNILLKMKPRYIKSQEKIRDWKPTTELEKRDLWLAIQRGDVD